MKMYASHTIIPWFSPSKSYIMLDGNMEVACGEKMTLDVYYTFDKNTDVKSLRFNYMVQEINCGITNLIILNFQLLSRGELITKGGNTIYIEEHTFAPETFKEAFFTDQANNASLNIGVGKWSLKHMIVPNHSPE
jgi:hypothetical protein